MKKSLILAGLLSIGYAYTQTAEELRGRMGLNTTSPNATLEVKVADINASNDTNQGMLIPKLTKTRVAGIADSKLVKGTLVFVEGTTYAGTNAKVVDINADGFYYYNGTKWIRVEGSGSGTVLPSGNANGQVLKWNGTAWIASTDDNTNLYTNNGTLAEARTVNMNGKNLMFTGNGNVGIGTATPTAKLHVAGGEIMTTWRDGFRWVHGNYGMLSTNDGNHFYLIPTSQGNPTGPISANRPFSYSFATKNLSFMTGTGDGNVGIGTGAPTAKLHVTGGEIMNTNSNGFRWAHGNYGMISRNDGGHFYLLPTASGDAMGGWSAYRPFAYNFATRNLYFMIGANDGNVGIGTTTPAEKLAVVGNVAVSGFVKTASLDLNSDKRLKTNINTMPDGKSIEQIKQLNPVTYYWNTEGKAKGGNDKLQYGLIAQEVEKVFPEMVNTDKEGYKSVNYIELIPVLLKAVQEQQKEIEVLKKKIK